MRIGLFPGQADALRAAYAEQRRRLTRRGLFLAAGSSMLAGACGFAAGRSTAAVTNITKQPPPHSLHEIALGALDELRRQAMHIEAALESSPRDPVLGLAFQRLVTFALTHPEDEALARRLLRLGERADMPAHFAEGAQALRAARGR